MRRPDALNALNVELAEGLREAVLAAQYDSTVRCVVVRGGEHFMAGGDIRWFAENLDKPPDAKRVYFEKSIREVHRIILSIQCMHKPVVASVNGAAAGFGFSLMMACDLVIAAENAFFTLAYVNLGLSPDGGATFALPRIVGAKKAAEIAFLGDRFDAATARGLGLVNWVVPAAELEDETTRLAARLAQGPTEALGCTKVLLNGSLNASLEAQLRAEADSFARCASQGDFAEGVSAFIAKRPPLFGGR